MATVLKMTDYSGGGGDGPIDPRDITIYVLETQLAEFRAVIRRLLESEGEEATEAMEAAERLLDGYDQVDREVEDEAQRERYWKATHCECGVFKGYATSYCPECDKEALERMKNAPDWSNVSTIGPCPF